MSLIYVIEDEPIMAECIGLAAESTVVDYEGNTPIRPEVLIFNDAVSAVESLNEEMPDLILLDVMLSGPDGFAFLNELISYQDTARIPVALITSLDLSQQDLTHYGVFKIINKSTMTPEDIQAAILEGLSNYPQPEVNSDPGEEFSQPENYGNAEESAETEHPSALIDEVLGMPPADYTQAGYPPVESAPGSGSDSDPNSPDPNAV